MKPDILKGRVQSQRNNIFYALEDRLVELPSIRSKSVTHLFDFDPKDLTDEYVRSSFRIANQSKLRIKYQESDYYVVLAYRVYAAYKIME